jgi:hypothetical protein
MSDSQSVVPTVTDGANLVLDVGSLKKLLRQRSDEHDRNGRIDSALYNGGTVIVLAATVIAALWLKEDPSWWPKILSALAAFLVSMERALKFGERWRFHGARINAYGLLLAKLETGLPMTADEIRVELEKIFEGEAAFPT